MSEPRRIQPLGGRHFSNGMVALEAMPSCARFSLRVSPDAAEAIGQRIGLSLPADPCTSARGDTVAALWLGPDEWLLLAPEDSDLAARPGEEEGFSLVDISHGQCGIRVAGAGAADALNSGCPLDLRLNSFPPGTCTRTVLAKSQIVLWREEAETFRVECARSHGEYVWQFLADAAISLATDRFGSGGA